MTILILFDCESHEVRRYQDRVETPRAKAEGGINHILLESFRLHPDPKFKT